MPLYVDFIELDATTEGKDFSFLFWLRFRLAARGLLPPSPPMDSERMLEGGPPTAYVQTLATPPEDQEAIAAAIAVEAARRQLGLGLEILRSEDGMRVALVVRWEGEAAPHLAGGARPGARGAGPAPGAPAGQAARGARLRDRPPRRRVTTTGFTLEPGGPPVALLSAPGADGGPQSREVERWCAARDLDLVAVGLSDPPEAVDGVQLVIALGGDGTILRALRLSAPHGLPVLGVNFGHVGFLADVQRDQLTEALAAVARGPRAAASGAPRCAWSPGTARRWTSWPTTTSSSAAGPATGRPGSWSRSTARGSSTSSGTASSSPPGWARRPTRSARAARPSRRSSTPSS